MRYDRGDCFPLDFQPNVITFGSKSEGKLSPRSYPIQCEWKHSFFSARHCAAPSYDESYSTLAPLRPLVATTAKTHIGCLRDWRLSA